MLVPRLLKPIVELPENTPNKVVILVLPTILTFLTTSLVAPKPGLVVVVRQTTAELVPALVLLIVKSLDVPLTAFEPSIVTKSAPSRLITQLALLPVMAVVTPVFGLIVTVLVALEPLLALIVSGKVSAGVV